MKNLKKWLALLLLVVMAVTLTACGDKKEEPKAEQPAVAVHRTPPSRKAPVWTNWWRNTVSSGKTPMRPF